MTAYLAPPGGRIQVQAAAPTHIQLVYLHAAHVTGTVRDEAGGARPGVTVIAQGVQNPSVSTTSRSDGTYDLYLAPDTWTIFGGNVFGYAAPQARVLSVGVGEVVSAIDLVYTGLPVLQASGGAPSLVTVAGQASPAVSFVVRNAGAAAASRASALHRHRTSPGSASRRWRWPTSRRARPRR